MFGRAGQAEINERWLCAEHLAGESLGRKTAAGTAIGIGAQIVKMLIQLLGSAALARLLTPADFGLVAMAGALVAFVGMFADIGLGTSTMRASNPSQRTTSTLFFIGLGIGLGLALATAAAAPFVSVFFRDPRVGPLVMGLALSVPMMAASAQHNAILTRNMRWTAINLIGVGAQAGGAATGVLLAWLTPLGYWALLAQALVASAITLVATWAACSWRPSAILAWSYAQSEIKFGLSMTGFSILNYFHRQIDNVLIGRRWGAEELGYYSRAYTLLLMPTTLVSGPAGAAVMPLLSRHQNNPEVWRSYLLQALAWVCFAGYAIAAVLVVNAEALIEVVLGPGWGRASAIFLLLAFSLFGATPMNATGWIYVSLGRGVRMLKWQLIASAVYVSAFLIGLPGGAPGVAFQYAMAVNILALFCLAFASFRTPVSLVDMLLALVSPLIASAMAVGGGWALIPHLTPLGPLGALAAGSMATLALFSLTALGLLHIDPNQRRQRETLRISVTWLFSKFERKPGSA